ncbi:MAG: DUF58 domain-containing protein [Brachymonas sp.]|nr:DUF58 domain-containing protein [Brachymonas sp.]MDO4794447.1 DUF58 domain-containing protein [Brachymonas sp.]
MPSPKPSPANPATPANATSSAAADATAASTSWLRRAFRKAPRPAKPRKPGWRARLQQWFWARLPRRDSTVLQQRNLYILPTGAGWLLLATLLALLIASINYQLNLGYLLTFLITGCAVISVPMTHNTLRGLQAHIRPPAPQYAGRPVLLDVHLHNPAKRRRFGLGLRLQEAARPEAANTLDEMSWLDCAPQSTHSVQLAWQQAQRGWHDLPLIHLETRFPLGVFRVWSVWRPDAQVLLYPTPETPAPALPAHGGQPPQEAPPPASSLHAGASDELPEDIRPYQRGDSPRHILWKKVAQTGELFSRESRRPSSPDLWLDFDAAEPQRGSEAALSRLCAWVQAASEQDQPFGLRLPPAAGQPAVLLAPAVGEAHRQRCLQALAEWGLPPARVQVAPPSSAHTATTAAASAPATPGAVQTSAASHTEKRL